MGHTVMKGDIVFAWTVHTTGLEMSCDMELGAGVCAKAFVSLRRASLFL